MTRVTLDSAALSQLDRLTEPVAVCDGSGRVVGYYRPARDVNVPFTDEELNQFEQEPGGRSLAEILAELKARP